MTAPLARRCQRAFPIADRARGEAYFRAGRVRLGEASGSRLEATVQGNRLRPYRVGVDWELAPERLLEVGCDCPRFADELVCKHLWATLLAADAAGLADRVPGDRPLDTTPLEEPFDADEAPWSSGGQPATGSRPAAPGWRTAVTRLASEVEAVASDRRRVAVAPSRRVEVYYVLDIASCLRHGAAMVGFYQQEERADGALGAMKPLAIGPGAMERLDPPHRHLVRLLKSLKPYSDADAPQSHWSSADAAREAHVPGPLLDVAFPRLAETGRLLLWDGEEGRPDPEATLAWDDGPPWRLALELESRGEEPARVRGLLRRDGETLPLGEPRLLLRSGLVAFADRLARLDAFEVFPWIARLRHQGPLEIPSGEVSDAVAALHALPHLPPLELPEHLAPRRERVAPVATLRLRRGQRWEYPAGLRGRVGFRYGGERVALGDPRTFVASRDRLLERDPEAEREALAALAELGLSSPARPEEDVDVVVPERGLPRVAEALLAAGWEVEVAGSPVRRAGSTRVSVASGIDWLELSGDVAFGEEVVSLPALLTAARHGERLLRLDDGTYGLLADDWLERYGSLGRLAHGEEADRLRFSPGQAMLLDVLLAELPEVDVDAAFARLRQRLHDFRGFTPATAPRGFRGELRPYQEEGLGWLRGLVELGIGGCLADDMGLGKTVQMLALLQGRRARPTAREEKRPSLVVAPRSLVFNWLQEAARFTPRLRTLDYSGPGRRQLRERFGEHDLVLTTYGTLARDIAHLARIRFDVAVLDEAQAIKNPASQRAKACRLIAADHRFVLTGTPVENHLGDLWSIFEFLNPGLLGGLGKGGSAAPGEVDLERLGRALSPFILRRTKRQVARELPEKTEQVLWCDLSPPQRRQYDELREHYRARIGGQIERQGLARSKIHVLEALLRLRQAACHPALLDPAREGEPSAKLDTLVEQLEELIEEGNKALVFSQFTTLLGILRRRLDAAGITYEYLDGQTRDRAERVERFQNDPGCPLFLVSLKAGGVGLNLTAAGYVYLLDPWWNPAVEAQAIDRTHRIGQTQPVFAYRLIARDTVEEKILELQSRKRDLAESLFTGEESLLRTLTAEDLEVLLG